VGRLEGELKADFVVVGGLGGDGVWEGGDGEGSERLVSARVEETWFGGVKVWEGA